MSKLYGVFYYDENIAGIECDGIFSTKEAARKRERELENEVEDNIHGVSVVEIEMEKLLDKVVSKVVVASTNANGEPDFYFCKVSCSIEDKNEGKHYEIAKNAAVKNGYEGPMVAYDENDPPKSIFELFRWETASLITE